MCSTIPSRMLMRCRESQRVAYVSFKIWTDEYTDSNANVAVAICKAIWVIAKTNIPAIAQKRTL